MFSNKKKGLHFDSISDFPIFLRQSGCSLKKKKSKGLPFDFISAFPLISLPKSGCSLKKKGPQSESFSEGNVAANNFHTAIIVRKKVSTTTFACFCGAPDKVSRRTVWEPLAYSVDKGN